MSLESVKTLIGVDDKRIDIVYQSVRDRLLHMLKMRLDDVEDVPESLNYIVDEVAIVRFNRIGSEGMTQESMDGHSATYVENDFAPYRSDIDDYVNKEIGSSDGARRGKVRFL